MSSGEFYPVFLALAGKICVVAGFGAVGRRKIRGLLAGGAREIHVFDPAPRLDAEGVDLLKNNNIKFFQRACAAADLDGAFLAFAATSDKIENSRLCSLCREKGILRANASNPKEGDFILPSVARRGNLRAALSTGGASPLLAGIWKKELEQWLGGKAILAWLMGALRPAALLAGNCASHAELFKKIVASPLPDYLAAGDASAFMAWFAQNAPDIPKAAAEKIFKEYSHVFPG